MIKSLFAVFALVFLISACRGSFSEDYRANLNKPPSPDVIGVDANNDGVRDDVAEFVNGLNITQAQKKHLMVYAAGLQQQATYFNGSIDNPDEHAKLMAQSTVCVLSSFEDFEMAVFFHKKLQSLTANTSERTARLLRYSHSRNGTVVRLPPKENCTN